jgi:urate oxidase
MGTVKTFLEKYPPDIQAITNQLREMVRGVMPQTQEILYTGENHFDYSGAGKRNDASVYICLLQDYVRLGFYWDGQLPDPKHLLPSAVK